MEAADTVIEQCLRAVHETVAPLTQRADRIDARMGQLERSTDTLRERVAGLDRRTANVERAVIRLDAKIDGGLARLDDKLSARIAALDGRLCGEVAKLGAILSSLAASLGELRAAAGLRADVLEKHFVSRGDLQEQLHGQTQRLVGMLIGWSSLLVALAWTAARLVH